MEMIPLCILLPLVPLRDAWGEMEEVVSRAQPTETTLNTARGSDHPVALTALQWATPTEQERPPGGVTTAAPTGPAHFWSTSTEIGCTDTYIVVFLIVWAIIGFWFCYIKVTPFLRAYNGRSQQAPKHVKRAIKRAHRSSGSDDDDVPFLSSVQDRPQKMF